RSIALSDRSNRALGRGFFEVFGKQAAHGGVTRTTAAASHHHADQMAVAPAHRGHEIEAGGARVPGLDSINALDIAKQAIVVADRMTAVVERHRREIAVIARKTVLDG